MFIWQHIKNYYTFKESSELLDTRKKVIKYKLTKNDEISKDFLKILKVGLVMLRKP